MSQYTDTLDAADGKIKLSKASIKRFVERQAASQLGQFIEFTAKERKYIKAKASGLNREAATLAAGYKDRRATAKLEQRPEIQTAIARALNRAGLSDRKLAETFKKTLEANRPVVVDKEIHDYPDHPTRLKAAETIAKLKGHYEGTDGEKANNISININFVASEPEAIVINPEVDNAV